MKTLYKIESEFNLSVMGVIHHICKIRGNNTIRLATVNDANVADSIVTQLNNHAMQAE